MGKKLTQEEVSKRIFNFFEENVELISDYKDFHSDITLKCNNCGYIWTTKAYNALHLSKDTLVHHCPNCSDKLIPMEKIQLKCDYCGKIFNRSKSEVERNRERKTDNQFCSIECRNKFLADYNRKRATSNYRSKAFYEYPHKCACCGYDEDKRILEVHHIDSNRDNNNIDNLIILCPNCHRKITLGYYKLDIKNQKLIEIK